MDDGRYVLCGGVYSSRRVLLVQGITPSYHENSMRQVYSHQMKRYTPILQRLFSKVAEDSNGCWIWQGTVNGAGYGTIGLGSREAGKDFVHRVSYRLFHGHIPDGLFVLHKCDVKRCCNPMHLFCGTQQDNLDDAVSKGRTRTGNLWWTASRAAEGGIVKGESHGMAKLSESDVRDIRHLSADGMNSANLSRRFGVSRRMIRNILNRTNWKHVV